MIIQQRVRGSKWTDGEIGQVEELIVSGVSYGQIGSAFGVSHTAINHLISRYPQLKNARRTRRGLPDVEALIVERSEEDDSPKPYFIADGKYLVAEGRLHTEQGISLPYVSILEGRAGA